MSSRVPAPLRSSRRPAIHTAAMIPSAIINPYAVRRSGPIDRAPLDGLGILATIISTPSDYYDGL